VTGDPADRPAMLVREAAPGEYAEVGRITADAYREFVTGDDPAWTRYLDEIGDVAGRADRTTILVAEDDGRIVGSVTLELDDRVEPDDDPPLAPDEAHIRMLGVRPDLRRRGVARSLMAACFERARARGKTVMTLHTTPRMTEAQRMYEALGFERLADRVFPDGFVLLTYRRAIDRSPA
jgi:ribosomal protein S18 acetylase RimI-like enzyme